MKVSKKMGATLGAVALLVGGSGVALAAIPDSDDGEFHACVANTGPVRAMYAIDAEGSESCAAGYTEKAWGTEPTVAPKGTWITVEDTATCGQSAPFNKTILVDLPADKRGIYAWSDTNGPDVEHWAEVVNSSGSSVSTMSPLPYHYDAEGRIDGVYLKQFADGAIECDGGANDTMGFMAKMFVYDIS